MFDDFLDNDHGRRRGRRRFHASLAAATLIFGGSSAAAISATSGIGAKSVEEDLLQVEFRSTPPEPPAPLPEAAPPPAVEAAPAKPVEKPKPKRLEPPRRASQTVLPESDRALPEAVAAVSVEGVSGGTGTAPARPLLLVAPAPPVSVKTAPRLTPLTLPVAQSAPRPKYSMSARRKGIEGAVVVAFDVLEDGSVANVVIVSGAEELHRLVIKAVSAWRFRPAQRGGKAVRHRIQQRVVFNLQDE